MTPGTLSYRFMASGFRWILDRDAMGRWFARRAGKRERFYLPGETRDTAVHYLEVLACQVEGA